MLLAAPVKHKWGEAMVHQQSQCSTRLHTAMRVADASDPRCISEPLTLLVVESLCGRALYSIPMPCPCCCNTGLIHSDYT